MSGEKWKICNFDFHISYRTKKERQIYAVTGGGVIFSHSVPNSVFTCSCSTSHNVLIYRLNKKKNQLYTGKTEKNFHSTWIHTVYKYQINIYTFLFFALTIILACNFHAWCILQGNANKLEYLIFIWNSAVFFFFNETRLT